MSRVRPLLFASVAVVLIAGAGCGSSSSSGGSSAANAGLGVTTTTPPTTQSGGGGTGGGSSFCSTGKADLASLQAKLASFASGANATALKSQMLTIQKAYQQAQSQAPSEIAPDLAAINTFITKLNQVFAAHQWNLIASAPEAAPLLQNNNTLKAHMNHLKAWATANCS
jgi:hypothetical protein